MFSTRRGDRGARRRGGGAQRERCGARERTADAAAREAGGAARVSARRLRAQSARAAIGLVERAASKLPQISPLASSSGSASQPLAASYGPLCACKTPFSTHGALSIGSVSGVHDGGQGGQDRRVPQVPRRHLARRRRGPARRGRDVRARGVARRCARAAVRALPRQLTIFRVPDTRRLFMYVTTAGDTAMGVAPPASARSRRARRVCNCRRRRGPGAATASTRSAESGRK